MSEKATLVSSDPSKLSSIELELVCYSFIVNRASKFELEVKERPIGRRLEDFLDQNKIKELEGMGIEVQHVT